MTKVVMLTAMAGAGLDLAYGDVFETDETEAARFLEHQAAREFDPKLDANKPVKCRDADPEEISDGHFQSEVKKKPKSKKQTTGQGDASEVTAEANTDIAETIPADSDAVDAEPEREAPAQESRPRRRR